MEAAVRLGSRRWLASRSKSERSPPPGYDAATKGARLEFLREHAESHAAFRPAAEDLKNGIRRPEFPAVSLREVGPG